MIMQIELNKLFCGLWAYKLSLISLYIFYKTKVKRDMCLYMHDHEIKPVSTTKFLGVILDKKIQWLYHIYYIKNKISKTLEIIYKVKKML